MIPHIRIEYLHRIGKYIETESRIEVPRGWETREWEGSAYWLQNFCLSDRKVSEIYNSDGYTEY